MDDSAVGTATVNHVGLCVQDLDVAVRFWSGLLGFTEAERLTFPDEAAGPLLGVEPPVGLEVVYLRLGRFTLELLSFERPGNPPPRPRPFTEPGLTHLSFSVDDPVAVAERAVELGGSKLFATSRAAMVRDPDGQTFELLPRDWRDVAFAG